MFNKIISVTYILEFMSLHHYFILKKASTVKVFVHLIMANKYFQIFGVRN